jgi:hypothetical protein
MKAGLYYGAVLGGILVGVISSPYIFPDYTPLIMPPSIVLVIFTAWIMRPVIDKGEE